MITEINTQKMEAELVNDEGIRDYAYPDSLGFLTIGVGHLIDKRRGGKLPGPIIQALLEYDIAEKLEQIKNEPWFLACDCDARRRALVNMAFQLGVDGLKTFKNSLGFIQQKNWAAAGTNLRKSIWYKQTPVRAERVIRMIEVGGD